MAEAAYELVYDEWQTGITVDGATFAVKRVAAGEGETEDTFMIRITRPATFGNRVIYEGSITQTVWEDISGASVDTDET